jgi:acetylornithine deacetylase/succinyl-diaminopimelate desuccinylase-like protein
LSEIKKVYDFIEENQEIYIEWLKEFCSIPSVAAQNRGMKESVTYLKQIFKNELDEKIEVIPTNGYPLLYSESAGGNDKTLSFYNHYDVQPEDPIDLWDTPPFMPTEKKGKLFARGVADNKGNLIARIAAVHALKNVYHELPINIKFLLEGEEEIGSVNLGDFSKHHVDKLKADACIWEFGYRDMDQTLQLTLGVKGMLYVELHTEGANVDLHSANASIIKNPAWRLIWALNLLKNEEEEVLIPGFYDDILTPTREEIQLLEAYHLDESDMLNYLGIDTFINDLEGEKLKEKHLFKPTCNICGINSGYSDQGAKTVLPSKASAKLDFRLVPGQDPEKVLHQLRQYLDDNGFNDVKISSHSKERAARTSPTEEIADVALKSIKKVTNKNPNIVPNTPGTGPMYELCQKHNIPSVSFGVGHFSSNNHAPNENIYLKDFIEGIKIISTLIDEF